MSQEKKLLLINDNCSGLSAIPKDFQVPSNNRY